MATPYVIIIPARLGSSRLAEKVLLSAAGQPLVMHTWQAARCSGADRVIIATDSQAVVEAVSPLGAEVVMTGPADSGTDRLAQVAQQLGIDDNAVVVNLQADEPLMPAAVLDTLADELSKHPTAAIATACCPIVDSAELFDPNAVKVVLDADGNALYFSRAPLPYERGRFDLTPPAAPNTGHLRHLGVYAYRAAFLKAFSAMRPSEAEQAESLEQLRALYYGYQIRVVTLKSATPPGIDTEKDWQAFSQYINSL
ncbi:MAG: 3-deoxy-manno-octulosonate cytidylyltransferase [Lysobacterales bacterium]